MLCPYCGENLEDEALFCSACGKPVSEDAPSGNRGAVRDIAAPPQPSGNPSTVVPARQKRSRGGGLKGKIPTALAVIVFFALVAGIGYGVYNFVTNPSKPAPAEPSSQSASAASDSAEDQSSEASQSQAAPRKLTEAEKSAVASLDGWWTSGSFQGGTHFTLLRIDGGTITRYLCSSSGIMDQADATKYEVTEATRADTGYDGSATSDYKTHDGEQGFAIDTTLEDEALWLFDGDPDALVGTSASFTRITDDNTLSSLRTQASALEDGGESNPFADMDVEEARREAAVIAGKQVFTGTVHMTTVGERAYEVAPQIAPELKDRAKEPLALLLLYGPQDIEAQSVGANNAIQLRSGQDTISMADPTKFEGSDGLEITVAAYAVDLIFPDDELGELYSASGAVEPITTLIIKPPEPKSKESKKKSAQSSDKEDEDSKDSEKSDAAATSGDYILPESATRSYSRDELEKLDTHTLFIARNEIYARHGRKFQSDELQKYFGAKSWYKGTIDSASFNESDLSQTEIDNINLMHDIEAARNSPYL